MSEGNISFVALVTREGLYREGDVFRLRKDCELYDKVADTKTKFNDDESLYAIDGYWLPLLGKGNLKSSPDFKQVEELWMPEVGEDGEEGEEYWTVIANSTPSGMLSMYRTTWRGTDIDMNKLRRKLIFRTEADCQSAIDESNALIKKLSDESRGKK